MPDPLLQLEEVSLRYGPITALHKVSLEVGTGEFVCLRGPSGSGKTSALLLAGGMLRPTEGTVRLAGRDLYALDPRSRGEIRASQIGFAAAAVGASLTPVTVTVTVAVSVPPLPSEMV